MLQEVISKLQDPLNQGQPKTINYQIKTCTRYLAKENNREAQFRLGKCYETGANIKGIIIYIHGMGSHFQPVYYSIDEFTVRDEFFSKFGFKSFALEFHLHFPFCHYLLKLRYWTAHHPSYQYIAKFCQSLTPTPLLSGL